MKKYSMRYYIFGRETIARREELSIWYMFRDNKWIRPEKEIRDYLDKYLRSKAKHRYPKIREITYEEMADRISETVIRNLIRKWKDELEEQRKAFGVGWPMKLVTIEFRLREKLFEINADDMGWSDEFMDSVMDLLLKDLEDAGAEILFHGGFYD